MPGFHEVARELQEQKVDPEDLFRQGGGSENRAPKKGQGNCESKRGR